MKNFKKYYIIPAPPEEIYNALTIPISLQLWTGEKAIMSTEPNSEFSLWDGAITGTNIEFETNKKIVQHWNFGEQAEPSVVTFKLHEHGNGTSVELLHNNIPDDDFDEIVSGWNDEYFDALYDFFAE